MPAEASTFRSHFSQHSTSEASTPPRGGSISGPHMGQPATATTSSLPQPSGTMSIGSIIEPNMRSEYASHPAPGHELSHAPIGTAPRTLPPELIYGLSPCEDSTFYSSSDSCYSPLSDYLQPQAVPQPFYSQDVIPRPHSTSMESCFQPMAQSPVSVGSIGANTPSWSGYDPSSIGFGTEGSYLPPVSSSLRAPFFKRTSI